MKQKLIVGNWKMNGSLAANEALLDALLQGVGAPNCDVAVCVPATQSSLCVRNFTLLAGCLNCTSSLCRL